MAIILRLQGLDVKAGIEDIRALFKCLHIPDGGVYIVGGSLREAFIAFATERDAQLAMQYSGTFLKGSKVILHKSSMGELEHKLKSLLKRKKPSPTPPTLKKARPSPATNLQPLNAATHFSGTPDLQPTTASRHDPRTVQPLCPNLQPSNSLDSSTAFLLGVCTVLQGLQSSHQRENGELLPKLDFLTTNSTVLSTGVRAPEQTLNSKPGYVRVFGMPTSVTKEVICRFFKGLTVQEAIVNIKLGHGTGCLVKFASEQEACDAFLFNKQSLGLGCVEIRGATEKMWTSALQECDNTSNMEESMNKKSPLRETANHKQQSTALLIKKLSVNRMPSEPPKKAKSNGDTTPLSPTVDYTVMVRNLPKTMTKTEIKELLGCPNIAHKNVLHLLDKEGNRTDTAFINFNCTEDYEYAMNLSGCHVGSGAIEVSSITKITMRDMMAKTHFRNLESNTKKKPNRKRRPHPVKTPEAQSTDMDPAAPVRQEHARRCIRKTNKGPFLQLQT
uniref:RNA binding motif protein 12Ba n=1 Tax=Scatophagus argus TaxID=75038 RepID=UPI001ED7D608|nr:RNA binding motif protein 12Ba [Scatophagus argus]